VSSAIRFDLASAIAATSRSKYRSKSLCHSIERNAKSARNSTIVSAPAPALKSQCRPKCLKGGSPLVMSI
jgi:hypothetical protein